MNRRAFTLIEIMMAMAGAAVILSAIYGIYSRAVHLRDSAMARTREVRLRAHAMTVLRNDLRNALVSGGLLATSLTGSATSHSGGFPGYLKFTTTTTPDTSDLVAADVQQVEFYVTTDPAGQDSKAGILVRAVDRNLLASPRETPAEEPLLTGVQSMEVTFFDGDGWKDSWEITSDDQTLPEAVRVRIRTVSNPAPIEVLVPWTTQAAIPAPTST